MEEGPLSRLPECLRHHILSFLPFKEAVTKSLLSRSWKDGWFSLPCLDLDAQFFYQVTKIHSMDDMASYAKKSQQFIDLVDRILTKRHKSKNYKSLRKLILYIPRSKIDILELTERLNKWVAWTVNEFHVKELEFTVEYDPVRPCYYQLPLSVLDSRGREFTSLALAGCRIDSPIRTNWSALRTLSLESLEFSQDLLDGITTNCLLLDDLSIRDCVGYFLSLNASLLKSLVSVEISCEDNLLKRIEIDAPNLLYFDYCGYGDDKTSRLSMIGLCASKRLKCLQLGNVDLTDEQFNRLLSQLPDLQELNLFDCRKVENIKISSGSLEVIEVNCQILKKIKVDAPQLKSFEYTIRGTSFPSLELNCLGLEEAIVELRENFQFDDVWYGEVVKFLACFNGLNNLEISPILCKGIMVPMSLRKSFGPPLHDVKHLSLSYSNKSRDRHDHSIDELLDALLWLCPHPETLLISQSGHVDLAYRRLIKFKYRLDEKTTEKCECCESFTILCWQQCLEDVTIVHKGFSSEPADKDGIDEAITGFFQPKDASNQGTIRTHVVKQTR